jgi:hypothetical protein
MPELVLVCLPRLHPTYSYKNIAEAIVSLKFYQEMEQ